MGCGSSAPTTLEPAAKASAKSAPSASKPAEAPVPDQGLSSAFRAVKFLGRGGTGDTWLYEDLASRPAGGGATQVCDAARPRGAPAQVAKGSARASVRSRGQAGALSAAPA